MTRNTSIYMIGLLLALMGFYQSYAEQTTNFNDYPQLIDKLQYSAKSSGIGARMIRTVEQLDDNLFKVSSRSKNALFSITEICQYRLDEQNNIVPLDYYYKLKSPFGKRKQIIKFDWDTLMARATYKKKTVEIPIEKGFQTDLSMQFQLQKDLAEGKNVFDYTIVRKHSTRDYHYKMKSSESIEINGVSTDAVLVERLSERKNIFIWVDPNQRYRLLKMNIISKKNPDIKINFVQSLL